MSVDTNPKDVSTLEKQTYHSSSEQSSIEESRELSRFAPVPFITWRMASIGLIVSLGGMAFGYDTGQISGFLAMESFKERFGELNTATGLYEFSPVRSGLLVGIVSIGNLCGSLAAGPLADRFGRKRCISLASAVYSVGLTVQITAFAAWYQLIIGRWLGGLGIGSLSILVPLYLSETSPAHSRGMVSCLYQLLVTLGILLANIVNMGTESFDSTAAWRVTMGLGFLWASVLGVSTMLFPESPKYAYRMGDASNAMETMALLLGTETTHPLVAKGLAEMKEKLEAERATSAASWSQIFTGPRMLYRVLLGIGLMGFMQLCGANFFFYYGTTIFAAAGLSNPFTTQTILGAINVLCTVPGLYFAARLSRRKCLTFGALWMAACFLAFASIGHFALDSADPTNTPGAGAAMIVFACLFISSFASTWGPMTWGETASLYPAKHRAACMSLATASTWLWNFLLAFFTPFVTAAIDYRYGYVFAAVCLVMAVVIYGFLLESQGRTLEELDSMYLLKVSPRGSAKWRAEGC